MATPNDPRRPQQRAPSPPAAPRTTPREEDEDDGRDDEVRPPAPREEDTLLAQAKRKLGLSDDATPLDLLRAVAGMAKPGYAGPPRAACRLRLSVEGRRVVLAPGDLIPEGVDLAALPAHAVEGR